MNSTDLQVTYSQVNGGDCRFNQYARDPLPWWATDVQLNFASLPLLERHVVELHAIAWAEDGCIPTMDRTLATIYANFERLGPFHYAKMHNLLVQNSGEEFAVQFMTAYNYSHPGTY